MDSELHNSTARVDIGTRKSRESAPTIFGTETFSWSRAVDSRPDCVFAYEDRRRKRVQGLQDSRVSRLVFALTAEGQS